METIVRSARKEDASSLYAISCRAHLHTYYTALIPREYLTTFHDRYRPSTHKRQRFISSINRKLNSLGWTIRVAEIKGVVVGYIIAHKLDRSEIQLKSLFVDPLEHKKGVGSILLSELLDQIQPGTAIELTVVNDNVVAKALYVKYGFYEVRPCEKNFFGARQVIMRREA